MSLSIIATIFPTDLKGFLDANSSSMTSLETKGDSEEQERSPSNNAILSIESLKNLMSKS